MKRFFSSSLLILASCAGLVSGCSVGSSSGSSILDNEFTSVGSAMAANKIAEDSTYYGRVLFRSGSGQLYGASIHFVLKTNNTNSAFFADFYLDRLVLFANMTTAVPIVTSSINLNVSGAYSFASNGMTITDVLNRQVGFNLNFGNNANFTDVLNASALFTRDFSTMVGGDNSTFFFIAEKANSIGTVSPADFLGAWYMIDFSVGGHGVLNIGVPSKMAVGGTGGSGGNYTVFRGTGIAGNVLYGGEYYLTDAGTGASGLGYDSTPEDAGSIRMDGTVDGAFLFAPSKRFILGFDARNNKYFAGSR